MFGEIAARYDLNNRLHSFGLDQRWRRQAVRAAGEVAGRRVLDAACGTGDLSFAFASAGAAEVVGVDFCEPMLEIARAKSPRRPASIAARVRFETGDATALSHERGSFDIVSIAFGIRNVSDPRLALREFRRVLRPGGRVVVLEFDEPRNPILRALSRLYTRRIMPRTAALIARDRSGAYRYLPRSVETFLDRDALSALLGECGFREAVQRPLCAGVAVVTSATAA
ncbi:MAG: ubiquinone/menaquinone biosynthesis methyltransferase [Phycisphaerae bacterium]|nr:ubiquinone/menaquinone biosynthesis methyltransferase [Phycisphaerae bacterium]